MEEEEVRGRVEKLFSIGFYPRVRSVLCGKIVNLSPEFRDIVLCQRSGFSGSPVHSSFGGVDAQKTVFHIDTPLRRGHGKHNVWPLCGAGVCGRIFLELWTGWLEAWIRRKGNRSPFFRFSATDGQDA